jgi:hypothetical protein
MFQCGTMTDDALGALEQLVRQAPTWLDVHLVGFSPDGHEPDPVTVAGHTLRYLMYSHYDFVTLGFPEKGAPMGPHLTFKLVPGNVDLMHLRFIADHPGYERYWWVEDDVRYGGDWSELFARFRRHPADLLGTSVRRRADDPDWAWWSGIELPGPLATDRSVDWITAFIPFGAVTPAGARAVQAAYDERWRGHYEALWPMAIAHAGLRLGDFGGCGEFVHPADVNRHYTSTPVRNLNPGTFQYRPYHEDFDRSTGKLWHPIRPDRVAPAARELAAEGDPAGCAP